MQQATHSLALRLFGPSQAAVTAALKKAAAEGCPGLNLLIKDGEYAVCVTARAETAPAARALCDLWEERFCQQFGPAVFGKGQQSSLAEAALAALADSDKLVVAADEATGQLLEEAFRGQALAEAVYDFGAQSWAHPKKLRKLEPDERLQKKYPGCPVQPVVSLAQKARKLSEADWSVAYAPAEGQSPAFVLVCGKKQALVCPLPVHHTPLLAAGWLLDMLRRLTLGLAQEPLVQSFVPGKAAPVLTAPTETGLPQVKPVAARSGLKEPVAPGSPIRPDAQLAHSAQLLFNEGDGPLPTDQPKQKGPARTHWGRLLVCLLLVAAIAGAAWFWFYRQNNLPSGDLGNVGYGTADYDTAARDFLLKAQAQNSGVTAYLALPKLPGSLVYNPGAGEKTGPSAVAQAAGTLAETPQLEGTALLGQASANAIVTCPTGAMKELSALAAQETLAQNSGFTLYTSDNTYRYKVNAVFYWDPAEAGETALDLYSLQDLSDYDTYLRFVLGARTRSLYDMPANVQDGDSFATLVADSAEVNGYKLVIVGRMVRQNEAAILFGRQVEQADEPLMPAALYQSQGLQLPSLSTLNQYWLNWYKTGGSTSSDMQEEAGMPDADRPLEEVPESGQPGENADPNASPEPGASPSPSLKPGETPSPSPTLKPGTTATPKPSATPTPKPGATATPKPTQAPTQAPTAPPTPEPTPVPSSGTITVTMNGVRQEMDLVECLAMIARNELGANAPYEAYKAQAVAAHSWILNQGGAPSVAGREPSETIRNAAREVANQVLTYGGSVAFTPYFASAAYGTNSSQEVWGGARPYLINVDSPYDKDYASNWQNTRTYYKAEVVARAQDRLGVDLNAYSENPEDWFGDIVKNSSGYVNSIRVGNVTTTGRKLRESILNDVNGKTLRSAAFDVSYDASAEAFNFTTYGYGHGCGLSQYGAWGYAANGSGYADILAHYFPGTSLETR